MRVTYLPVDEKGMISLDQLEDAICEDDLYDLCDVCKQ